jgi:hypothetical protein
MKFAKPGLKRKIRVFLGLLNPIGSNPIFPGIFYKLFRELCLFFYKIRKYLMIVLQKRQQFLLKVLRSGAPEMIKNFYCYNINYFFIHKAYTRYLSSNISMTPDKQEIFFKENNIFEINYLKVSDNNIFYLRTFKNNLLDF